jgi:hypothetical protein
MSFLPVRVCKRAYLPQLGPRECGSPFSGQSHEHHTIRRACDAYSQDARRSFPWLAAWHAAWHGDGLRPMVADMSRSDIFWGDDTREERMARLESHELKTRILENNNQLLADVIKPWQEFADAMEESQRQVEIERTADCAQRYLYDLCHAHEFAKVREILRHTHEYMAETIEVLEEQDAEARSHPAQFHRQSS